MHPSKAFDWTDRAEMLRFADERAFAHIFTASDAGQFVVHAPVLVTDAQRIRFHVANRNRIAAQSNSSGCGSGCGGSCGGGCGGCGG